MSRASVLAAGLAVAAALLVPVADSAPLRATATDVPQVYVIGADGTGETNITSNQGANDGPDWSPDGTKIAVSSHRDGNWEIYVMAADGTGAVRLTTNRSADDARPAWSPDGSKIAFHSDRSGDYEIYVMNADGTGQIDLTNERGSDDLAPTWSPDGTKIAFQSEGDIWVMNADGSLQHRLTSGAEYDLAPDWSPDGTKIALTGGGPDTGLFIDVINADGTGRTRLTTSTGDYYPEWSPDGTKIAFSSYGSTSGRLIVMNADGTGPRVLTNVRKRIDYESTWAPDGTRLAFAAYYDRTAPDLLVLVKSPQRAIKQKSVRVAAACSEPCALRASGYVSIAGQRRKIRLREVKGSVDAFEPKSLNLSLSASARRQISTALAGRKQARAVVSVKASDRYGNAKTTTRRVKLKR